MTSVVLLYFYSLTSENPQMILLGYKGLHGVDVTGLSVISTVVWN